MKTGSEANRHHFSGALRFDIDRAGNTLQTYSGAPSYNRFAPAFERLIAVRPPPSPPAPTPAYSTPFHQQQPADIFEPSFPVRCPYQESIKERRKWNSLPRMRDFPFCIQP
ncbi:hypothetical protein MRX96_006894 [Rhipicephalus microplus]